MITLEAWRSRLRQAAAARKDRSGSGMTNSDSPAALKRQLEAARKELDALGLALLQGRVKGASDRASPGELKGELDEARRELAKQIDANKIGREDVLQKQQEAFLQQDQALDQIAAQLGRVSQIGNNINDEVTLHNRLLDDIEEGVAEGNERMHQISREAERVNTVAGASTCHLWMAIFSLVTILLVLLLVF
mmetsp:Transcript_14207/g.25451  ORF Transcript_14207/g.25451 Transcript_14207/m.25451 type:complete len:192 (+) Transcript_14207:60-635(+)